MIGALIAGLGGLVGGAASTIGSVAGAAASGVGSLASSGISTLGAVGSSALGAAGTIAGGAVDLAGGAISTIGGVGQWAVANAPEIANVAGGVYGAYTSYEQAKAAREMAEKYGQQVNIPSIIPIASGSPSPQAAIPVLSYGSSPPMTEEERLYQEALANQQSDTQKFFMYGLIAFVAYMVLKKAGK